MYFYRSCATSSCNFTSTTALGIAVRSFVEALAVADMFVEVVVAGIVGTPAAVVVDSLQEASPTRQGTQPAMVPPPV